jgi:hypothetical protein
MHTDEYYKSVVALFRKENPELCNDPERLQSGIDKLDNYIDTLIETKLNDWKISVNISLQARNPLAIILGIQIRDVDYDAVKSSNIITTKNPIPSDKFVILLCNSASIARAINAILPTVLRDEVRFKILDSQSAVSAIIKDSVAGIVDFNYNSSRFTTLDLAYSLRHDLKNREGWNQEMADNKILPPLSITNINQVHNGFGVALDMANGTYHSSEVVKDVVNLGDYRSSFIARMKVPKYIPNVTIVDDYEPCIRGMLYLLNIWPNIDVKLVHEFGDKIPYPRVADIVLLDHDLGSAKYNGSDLLRNWYAESEFKGTVISTTSGDRQPYGSYHFKRKHRVATGHLDSCNEFIALINQVIETLDNQ